MTLLWALLESLCGIHVPWLAVISGQIVMSLHELTLNVGTIKNIPKMASIQALELF